MARLVLVRLDEGTRDGWLGDDVVPNIYVSIAFKADKLGGLGGSRDSGTVAEKAGVNYGTEKPSSFRAR